MATATGTFYLRPSADISLTHPVVPDTLGAGYLAINEVVSDGAATYIGVDEITDGTGFDYTSTFKMSLDCEYKIKSILSAKFIFNGTVSGGSTVTQGASNIAHCECIVTLNGENVFSGERYEQGGDGKASDTLSNADMPNFVSVLNNFFNTNNVGNMPDIVININNSLAVNGGKGGTSYVSQVAIEIECEYISGLNIHHKIDCVWKQVQAAYQKQNGSWVEITEDECKSIMSNAVVVMKG